MSTEAVAVIVLNWNGIDDTIQCLDSLSDQSYKANKIVVIDNGSIDSSTERLTQLKRDYPDKLEVIYNKINLGFAGGVNTGIRWAIENKYDYVALFNNDATADINWLNELIRDFDDPSIGISTGLLLRADGNTIDSTGEQYSIWGLPFPRSRNNNVIFAPNSGLTFGATGGATIYRTKLFKDIGLFDEEFFAYYEDVDISFRAQLGGWKVNYNSDAIAYHKQGATSSKIPGFTVTQTFKNLPWLFIKNIPRGLIIFIGSRFFVAYILMLGKATLSGNGLAAFKGLIMSLYKTPKKFKERLKIQRLKKVDADYIYDLLWKDLPPDQTGLRKLRGLFTNSK